MNEAYVISHKQCPECDKLGKDNGHDNLAVYSDGHCWCFSCGYYTSGNRAEAYYRRHHRVQTDPQPQRNSLRLPADCTTGIPARASQWISQYGIQAATLTRNNLLWSESRQFLVFPYFIDNELVGWQGRYFGMEKDVGKWHTKGKPETYIYTLGANKGTVVLVEDIVSAIKVSRTECCSPIFGSVISNSRFIRLSKFFNRVVIWLDPDKQREAIAFAKKGRMFGLDCQVIMSDKDPKEYTYSEIQEYLRKQYDLTRNGITEHPT